MRTTTLSVGVLICAAALLWALQAPDKVEDPFAEQDSGPGVVTIRVEKGARILEELSKVERRLVVIDDSPQPFAGGSPGSKDPRKEIESLTRRATAVVVGQIMAIHPSVSADEMFVESTIDLRVDDVLKVSPRGAPVPGQVLTLRLHGGTLRIDDKELVARRSWARLPEEGQRYLYFLAELDDGSFIPPPETAIFQQTDQGLRRLGTDGGVDLNREAMARLTIESASDAARAAAHLPRIP